MISMSFELPLTQIFCRILLSSLRYPPSESDTPKSFSPIVTKFSKIKPHIPTYFFRLTFLPRLTLTRKHGKWRGGGMEDTVTSNLVTNLLLLSYSKITEG